MRFSDEMKARVDRAQKAMGVSEADILRMAINFGLKDLEAIDYDIHGAITKASGNTLASTATTLSTVGGNRVRTDTQ